MDELVYSSHIASETMSKASPTLNPRRCLKTNRCRVESNTLFDTDFNYIECPCDYILLYRFPPLHALWLIEGFFSSPFPFSKVGWNDGRRQSIDGNGNYMKKVLGLWIYYLNLRLGIAFGEHTIKAYQFVEKRFHLSPTLLWGSGSCSLFSRATDFLEW